MNQKKLNKDWHSQHVLGMNQPLEKRISWHIEHEKNCGCRPMPASIKKEVAKRKNNG